MKYTYSLLAALAITSAVAADDYIVVVFDTSGSMNDYMRSAQKSRMDVAKEAMISVFGKVPPTTKVGVLTFNGWAYELGPVVQPALIKAFHECTAEGSTPLYRHIKVGADRLLTERAKNLNVGFYKLLVVTDGEADRPDAALNKDSTYPDGSTKPGYLQDIINRGIVVDAIGLDMRSDHSLKTAINGSYMRGDDLKSVTSSLRKSVAEVGHGGKDGTTAAEVFEAMQQYPDAFVKASIKGLTSFQNQPIGELPPIEVVNEDGSVSMQDNPANTPSGGMGWVGWTLTIVTILVGLVFIGIIISTNRR